MDFTKVVSFYISLCVLTSATIANIVKAEARCEAKSDIILMVPRQSHNNSIADIDSFSSMENFLIKLVNYFELRDDLFNMGLMIYRRTSVILNDLRPFRDRKQINTRISLMANTAQFRNELSDGEENVASAIHTMIKMFTTLNQRGTNFDPMLLVLKTAVLFLNTTVNNTDEVLKAATEAKNQGITLYVVISGLASANTAKIIATDICKVFTVKDFNTDLERILPYLANSICAGIKKNLTPTNRPDETGKCHSAIIYRPPQPKNIVHCLDRDTLYPDPNNCAYFYNCKTGHPNKLRCYHGDVFDAHTQTCNHRDTVTCYSLLSCPTPTGLFPYPGDCRRFLNCFKGMPYPQFCPKGLIFDAKRRRCSHHTETKCVY